MLFNDIFDPGNVDIRKSRRHSHQRLCRHRRPPSPPRTRCPVSRVGVGLTRGSSRELPLLHLVGECGVVLIDDLCLAASLEGGELEDGIDRVLGFRLCLWLQLGHGGDTVVHPNDEGGWADEDGIHLLHPDEGAGFPSSATDTEGCDGSVIPARSTVAVGGGVGGCRGQCVAGRVRPAIARRLRRDILLCHRGSIVIERWYGSRQRE